MTPAFLNYHESFFRWLIYTDHIVNVLINWSVSIFLTFVVLRSILLPLVRRTRRSIVQFAHDHYRHQAAIVTSNEEIAKGIDTTTPGGLTDVVSKLDSIVKELQKVNGGGSASRDIN